MAPNVISRRAATIPGTDALSRAGDRIRSYRLLDLDDGAREYRTHSVTTAARTAAKFGSELLRFLDLTSHEVHAFQVIDGHRVRKICIESANDDDLEDVQKKPRKAPSSPSPPQSEGDWAQSLSQEKALNLSMIWDLNKVWAETTTPIRQGPARAADWSPNPTLNSQRSAIGAIRTRRKALRDRLRALKAASASDAQEKRALKRQKQLIRAQLKETDDYRDRDRR